MSDLPKSKRVAIIVKEFYRLTFMATVLLFLLLGDYRLKHTKMPLLYIFGGLFALGFVSTIIDRIKTIRRAVKAKSSIPTTIYKKDKEIDAKSKIIKQPKPVKGKLRYLAAWTLPSIFLIPTLLLSVTFPLAVAPKDRASWIALLVVELFFLGFVSWIATIVRRRHIEAKRLGISLTDSMIQLFENWEIRRQERLIRPSKVTMNQRIVLNPIGFLICVALINAGAAYRIHYRFFSIYHQEMLLGFLWLYTFLCPLNILSAYIENESGITSKP